MDVITTSLPGVLLFRPQPFRDERGFFTRTFDSRTARDAGLDPAAFVQDSQSRSHLGVVRGLHLRSGRGEAKLVRCAAGRIYDVVVDLRPGSPTFLRWEAFELDDEGHLVLYIPAGFGHGWQALTEPADVCYRIDAEHDSSEDVTIAFDDPDLAVPWPSPVTAVSARDRAGHPLAVVVANLRR